MTDTAPYTHEVVMRIRSVGAAGNTEVMVEWNPDLSGDGYKELGYQPPCHKFVERYILPMLEEAFMQENHPSLMEKGKPN